MDNQAAIAAARASLEEFLRGIDIIADQTIHKAFDAAIAVAVINLRKTVKLNSVDAARRAAAERIKKAERMADLIVDVTKDTGECTKDDLLRAGFTEAEINGLWPLAQGCIAARLPSHNSLNQGECHD